MCKGARVSPCAYLFHCVGCLDRRGSVHAVLLSGGRGAQGARARFTGSRVADDAFTRGHGKAAALLGPSTIGRKNIAPNHGACRPCGLIRELRRGRRSTMNTLFLFPPSVRSCFHGVLLDSMAGDGQDISIQLLLFCCRSRRYYTSSKLTTKNKFSFRYGRVEARIRLPPGGQVRCRFADERAGGRGNHTEVDVGRLLLLALGCVLVGVAAVAVP